MRIELLGRPGSGKTTLAEDLSIREGVEVVFEPGKNSANARVLERIIRPLKNPVVSFLCYSSIMLRRGCSLENIKRVDAVIRTVVAQIKMNIQNSAVVIDEGVLHVLCSACFGTRRSGISDYFLGILLASLSNQQRTCYIILDIPVSQCEERILQRDSSSRFNKSVPESVLETFRLDQSLEDITRVLMRVESSLIVVASSHEEAHAEILFLLKQNEDEKTGSKK